jgi:hypothetical protein
MHPLELQLLHALHLGAGSARTLCRQTTAERDGIEESVAIGHLKNLYRLGYAHLRKSRYAITPAGRAFLSNAPGPALPPPLHNNATTGDYYMPPAWAPTRPGATDFLACRSLASEWKEPKC